MRRLLLVLFLFCSLLAVVGLATYYAFFWDTGLEPSQETVVTTVLPVLNGDIVTTLIWGVVVTVCLGLVVSLVVALLPYFGKLLELLKPKPLEPVDETTDAVMKAMNDLSKTLARIERSGEKSAVLISDAETQVSLLVNFIKGFVTKAQDFRREIEEINGVIKALSSTELNIVDVTRLAHRLTDTHLRDLILLDVDEPRIARSVLMALAARLGDLQKWEETYVIFSVRLIKEVSGHKSTAARLSASLELLRATKPLAEITTGLNTANNLLQFKREPEQASVIAQLPSSNAHLL